MHNITYVSKEQLIPAGVQQLQHVEKLVDIGCGLRPMGYYKPRVHMCIEPCAAYAEVISNRYANEGGMIIVQDYADTALARMADNSVDAVYMGDVIEHIEKEVGERILKECVRVARKQVVIFTPLGFMPQEYENGGDDAWGLEGTTTFQEHLSGWLPEDFGDDWNFVICKDFHDKDAHGKPIDKAYGAFWAVLNKQEVAQSTAQKSVTLVGREVPPFPSKLGDALHTAAQNTNANIISTTMLAPYGRYLQAKPTRLDVPSVFFESTVFRADLKTNPLPYLKVALDAVIFFAKAWALNTFNRSTLVDCSTGKADGLLVKILAITSLKKPVKVRLNGNQLEAKLNGKFTAIESLSQL